MGSSEICSPLILSERCRKKVSGTVSSKTIGETTIPNTFIFPQPLTFGYLPSLTHYENSIDSI
jgi:hypothetical protein